MKKKALRRPRQLTPRALQVRASAPKKIAVSAGVIAGNKLGGMTPQYPPMARAARIQGTVVLGVEISTAGSVTNLKVISGSPMLQKSALQAVKTYRYKPYLLAGKTVRVDSQVKVTYKLPKLVRRRSPGTKKKAGARIRMLR